MKKLLILTICLGSLSAGFAQGAKVELKRQLMHPVQAKSMAALAMYKYQKDTISPSQDPLTKKTGAPFRISIPVMENVDDTAFGFLFFGGKETPVNRGFVLVMVNNYNSRKPQLVYIDRNFNEDLTDDGPPVVFGYKQDSIEFELQSNKPAAGKVRYRMSRFHLQNKKSFGDFMNGYYKTNSTNPGYLGIDKAYQVQTFNVMAGEYNNGRDSFSLALWDADNDGLYNEPEDDKLFTGIFGATLLPADQQLDVHGVERNQVFEWDLRAYRLLEADPQGTWLRFQLSDTSLSHVLQVGKKIPRAVCKNLAGNKIKLRKVSRKRQTYIYFYSLTNPELETDTAFLGKIQREFGAKVNVLAINYADHKTDLWLMSKYMGASWMHGIANRKLLQQFYIQKLPIGFLVAKRSRLKQINVRPEDYYQTLKSVK